ncbi:DUF4214 domain-containing protein [Vreelandella salicampi]|uniref:DUF4214 domain-containing protein n=1 Tax=Vreelandella salicampi TaxID=1449798 RepID=A0A7Z0RUN1_9GAMM|nr:DUF4214 domain-containing protein [Halomonas salicampi]NYS60355.1 DUF4214 domain-containing protein [Halomonas salicampi]
MTPQETIQLLYLTYFNRAADQAGLDYWQERLQAGEPIASLHQAFANPDVPEISALYADTNTVESYIDTVYRNLLNRDPDPDGADYWSGRLQESLDQGIPLENAGLALLAAFMNAAGGDNGVDTTTLANKLVIAETITETAAQSSDQIIALSQEYLGDSALNTLNEEGMTELSSVIKNAVNNPGKEPAETTGGGSSAPADTVPPEMVAAEVLGNGETIIVHYSESLSGSPAPSSFTLGDLADVTNVELSASNIELTLDRPLSSDAELSIRYDASASTTQTPLTDEAGNAASSQLLAEKITNNSVIEPEESISGTAQDGYLRYATVFMDLDRDGELDADEPQTVTDYEGNFTLLGGAGAPIIVYGGTDISTGLANTGIFKSPPGATIINPLTTLVAEIAGDSATSDDIAAAQAKVVKALGLSPDADLLSSDPIATALSTTASSEEKKASLDIQAASIQVANLISTTSSVLNGSDEDDGTAAKSAAASIANTIKNSEESANVDLSDSTTLAKIIDATATKSGKKLTEGQSSDAAGSLSNLNARVKAAASDSTKTPEDALNEAVKAQKVAQEDLSNALKTGKSLDEGTIEKAVNEAKAQELMPDMKEEGAPFLISTRPADDTANVSPQAKLLLTFNEAVFAQEGGTITLHPNEGEALTFDVTDNDHVSVVDNKVWLNPRTNLAVDTDFHVTISEEAFVDQDGETFAGISDSETLNFVTSTKSTMVGTDSYDYIVGTLGNDVIHGLAGNDHLEGGAGNDTLLGGPGNDVLYDMQGTNVLNGGAGDDELLGHLGGTFIGGDGNDTFSLWPYEQDYAFDQSSAPPAIFSDFTPGEDTLDLGDILVNLQDYTGGNPFQSGLLSLSENENGDAVLNARLHYHEQKEKAALIVFEGLTLEQISADDFTPSGAAPEGTEALGETLTVSGEAVGSVGDDTITIMNSENWSSVDAGPGNDVVHGSQLDDYIRGNLGDDTLNGGAGDDDLYDIEGRNHLNGGDGNDILSIAEGNTLTGGSGQDTFYLSSYTHYTGSVGPAKEDVPVITDFSPIDDVIDLEVLVSDSPWLENYTGGNPFDEALGFMRLVDSENGAWLEVAHEGSGQNYQPHLFLKGVSAEALSANNFAPSGLDPSGATDVGLTLMGTDASDDLRGGVGDDLLQGLGGDDWLYGDAGNDRLEGGSGNDRLEDITGTNHFDGGAGDDTLIGRKGDTFIGGEGNDTFQVELFDWYGQSGDGPAVIEDFEADIDVIDFSLLIDERHDGSSYSTLIDYTGGNPFDSALGYFTLEQQGEDAHINVDFDGVAGDDYELTPFIKLVGVNVNDLNSTSFSPEFELVASGGTGG